VGRDGSAMGILKPGDVLLDIDGYNIDRDGKVTLEDGLRVESSHLEYLKQVGSKLNVRILRDGKESVQQIPLTPRKQRISNQQFDRIPTYFAFAGVVFQPLTGDYLKSHHSSQFSLLSYIPEYTLEGYEKRIPDRVVSNRKQTIVISRVLPDTLNQGYKDMEGAVIYSVDDTPVQDMNHLISLVQNPQGKFIKFVTDYGSLMVFDLDAVKSRNDKILKNYQLYNDRSPDLAN
jgi:C-terminal processing protease CtpA/Prc